MIACLWICLQQWGGSQWRSAFTVLQSRYDDDVPVSATENLPTCSSSARVSVQRHRTSSSAGGSEVCHQREKKNSERSSMKTCSQSSVHWPQRDSDLPAGGGALLLLIWSEPALDGDGQMVHPINCQVHFSNRWDSLMVPCKRPSDQQQLDTTTSTTSVKTTSTHWGAV